MSRTAILTPSSAGNMQSPPFYNAAFNLPPQYSSSKGSRYSRNNENDFVSPLAQIGKKQQRKSMARAHSSDNSFVSPLSKISQPSRSKTAKHQRRRAAPSDVIDLLDESVIGAGHYHHEGPFDATLASRQVPGRAPVDALRYSTGQALAATPRANIIDSLTRKVPLQGTGMVPPGMVGPGGQRFDYQEENINQLEGKLGRWGGVNYLDEDLKGKGEPCYSYEEAEKAHAGKNSNYEQMVDMKAPNSSTRRRAASDVDSYYPYNINADSKPQSSSTGLFRGLRNKLSRRSRF